MRSAMPSEISIMNIGTSDASMRIDHSTVSARRELLGALIGDVKWPRPHFVVSA